MYTIIIILSFCVSKICMYHIDKPRIDAGALKDITVKAGQEFSLTAPFSGFPKPNAIWSKNEIDLDEKDPRYFLKVF